ncbi:DNA cytosine methyltransferase [Streptomyces sp. NPDC054796]
MDRLRAGITVPSTPADQPAVRALGAVLGSLADLGRDAHWCVLRASDVGAPHRRERLFLTAWRRDAAAEDADQQPRLQRRQPAPGQAEARWARPEPCRRGRVAPPPKASDVAKGSPHQRHGNGDLTLPSAAAQLSSRTTTAWVPAHPARALFDAAALTKKAPGVGALQRAIARWERLTRPAPAPTDDAGRLSPRFVEWMQGLDDGWVTATPDSDAPPSSPRWATASYPSRRLRRCASSPRVWIHGVVGIADEVFFNLERGGHGLLAGRGVAVGSALGRGLRSGQGWVRCHGHRRR